ncbi:hypothetical protein R3P38DRAFT_2771938 [Favolaschia claudopus]|uniref:Uncharacterized protein n=1 Tax=Favolaschia claudopus TaxID=2862362 RepID=A0AAW0C9C3_9AGAR
MSILWMSSGSRGGRPVIHAELSNGCSALVGSVDRYQPVVSSSAQWASAASGSTTQWASRRAQPRAAVGVWGGKPQPSGPAPAKVPQTIYLLKNKQTNTQICVNDINLTEFALLNSTGNRTNTFDRSHLTEEHKQRTKTYWLDSSLFHDSEPTNFHCVALEFAAPIHIINQRPPTANGGHWGPPVTFLVVYYSDELLRTERLEESIFFAILDGVIGVTLVVAGAGSGVDVVERSDEVLGTVYGFVVSRFMLILDSFLSGPDAGGSAGDSDTDLDNLIWNTEQEAQLPDTLQKLADERACPKITIATPSGRGARRAAKYKTHYQQPESSPVQISAFASSADDSGSAYGDSSESGEDSPVLAPSTEWRQQNVPLRYSNQDSSPNNQQPNGLQHKGSEALADFRANVFLHNAPLEEQVARVNSIDRLLHERGHLNHIVGQPLLVITPEISRNHIQL